MTLDDSAVATPSADPRIVHTRKVVLSAAIELLKTEGHEAVTPTRIADKTGVARTTIYRHWPARRDLVTDAIEAHLPDWDLESSGDIRADLKHYLGRMVARLGSGPLPPFFATLIERAEHDVDFADLHCRMAEHRSQPLVAALQAAIARGELPGDLDVPAAVAAIAGPVFYRRLISREPLTDGFVDGIVEGFMARYERAAG